MLRSWLWSDSFFNWIEKSLGITMAPVYTIKYVKDEYIPSLQFVSVWHRLRHLDLVDSIDRTERVNCYTRVRRIGYIVEGMTSREKTSRTLWWHCEPQLIWIDFIFDAIVYTALLFIWIPKNSLSEYIQGISNHWMAWDRKKLRCQRWSLEYNPSLQTERSPSLIQRANHYHRSFRWNSISDRNNKRKDNPPVEPCTSAAVPPDMN